MIMAEVLYFNILNESGEVYGYETFRVKAGSIINFMNFSVLKEVFQRIG